MSIGQLYNAQNVVVGQAAVFVSPSNTALPDFATLNFTDPFDPAPWSGSKVTVAASSTYTLSVGATATSSLSDTSTPAQIETALEAIPAVGTGNVTVTGTSTSYSVVFAYGTPATSQTFTANATTGSATIVGGLWTPVGATDQGWKFSAAKNTQTITIEEQSTPAGMSISSQAVTIDGSLSEDIAPTLALAYNGILTKTAAGSGVAGVDEINLTDTILYYSVALITGNGKGMPRIHYAPIWNQLTNAETTFRRAADKRMYPVSFSTLCEPSQIRILDFTGAPTA